MLHLYEPFRFFLSKMPPIHSLKESTTLLMGLQKTHERYILYQ
ncbi:MAG: hypothetical protein K0R51_3348 [Cytophagaceae bacterium]|jgi:hypothetical protein|nr:hypothetical protein [Cytophagaceae bacterium]